MQNIFDNKVFFDSYKKLRSLKFNYNILQEKPAIFSLLPPLNGVSILDMGCGFGENSSFFIKSGAKEVYGIDISKKMLEEAIKTNEYSNVNYELLPIENLSTLNKSFDLVFSSLAIHYVEDFEKIVKDVDNKLHKGGYFIFSQLHPFTSAPKDGTKWIEEDNKKVAYRLSDYLDMGIRSTSWYVDNLITYHRTVSYIINSLVSGGFEIVKILEPMSSAEDIKKYPIMETDVHKPNFLIIKARKK